MTRTILVAGAAGTIGTQLVRELKAASAPFEVMTSRDVPHIDGVPARRASYDNVASLTRAFSGVDTLFVLLPLVPHKLQLARNVAEAARAAGVRHIVRSSGAGADANAGFSLPRLQGQIDDILAATGIATTFLRPAGFMQNYTTFYAGMVKDGMVYGATADAPQSLVDARDIAAVAARVLLDPAPHAGKAYTLTSDEALTDSQRVDILSKVLGRPVGFTAVPLAAGEDSMRAMGMPAELVDWMGSLNAIISAGYASGTTGDVEALLGRQPIRFAQFARDYAASWK